MYEAASRITEAELEVMRALWGGDGPLTAAEVKAELSRRSGWNGDTVKTLLRRLCEKGAVGQEKREVYYYSPLVSAEEYGRYSTQRVIDKLYSGSAREMIAALVRNEQLRREDVEELRAMFREGGEGG